MPGALAGVRVLEVTSVVLGPYAAQILGDMGADVIKIEPPAGDSTRQIGPARHRDMAVMFLNFNRNKRSLVLDLKSARGREVFWRLAKTADVFLHNLRPRAVERLGLNYAAVKAVNERIIYCATYGYRKQGPRADYPAYDDIIQAASGVAGLQAEMHGEPLYFPTIVADKTTALAVVYAVSAALFARERHGIGQEIEVPMFETLVSFANVEHLYSQTYMDAPPDKRGYPRVLSPHRRPYRTKDGYVAILPHTDKHWRILFEAAGHGDLLKEPRFADVAARTRNIDELYGVLADIVGERTTAEWMDLLDPTTIPISIIQGIDELLVDDQLAASGFWQEVRHPSEGALRTMDPPVGFAETPSDIRLPAPRLGQHSRDILSDAGYDPAAIAEMVAEGITVLAEEDEGD